MHCFHWQQSLTIQGKGNALVSLPRIHILSLLGILDYHSLADGQ